MNATMYDIANVISHVLRA